MQEWKFLFLNLKKTERKRNYQFNELSNLKLSLEHSWNLIFERAPTNIIKEFAFGVQKDRSSMSWMSLNGKSWSFVYSNTPRYAPPRYANPVDTPL
jgi:hypothetical protein